MCLVTWHTWAHMHKHTLSAYKHTLRYRQSISISFHREVLLSMKTNVKDIIQNDSYHTSSPFLREHTHATLTSTYVWFTSLGKYALSGICFLLHFAAHVKFDVDVYISVDTHVLILTYSSPSRVNDYLGLC